jgi:two-component system sensor histidine kinase SenX3
VTEGAILVVGLAALAVGIVLGLMARRDARPSTWRIAQLDRSVQRAREDLRIADDERRLMQLVLSSMNEGVLLFGGDGRRRFANPAAGRLLGARPSNVQAILPLRLREAVRAAASDGGTTTVDGEVGTPTRALRGAATPVGGDGSVLLIVSDVTETLRIERMRRDFVTNASHELKTPAAAIQATAETIRTAAADDVEAVPGFAEQLEREAARLSRIVSDLLDLSRLEAGTTDDDDVSLDGVLRDEADRCNAEAGETGVAIEIRTVRVPPVSGSRRDLSLLIRNLLDNAVRYTASGGRVAASLRVDGDDVVLTVADDGVGIPSRDLERIFERFYRVDRARSRGTGGTGLGLAIVKHVVENHGGTVSVDSELGRGTTFEVRLPAAHGNAPSILRR